MSNLRSYSFRHPLDPSVVYTFFDKEIEDRSKSTADKVVWKIEEWFTYRKEKRDGIETGWIERRIYPTDTVRYRDQYITYKNLSKETSIDEVVKDKKIEEILKKNDITSLERLISLPPERANDIGTFVKSLQSKAQEYLKKKETNKKVSSAEENDRIISLENVLKSLVEKLTPAQQSLVEDDVKKVLK